MSKVQKLLAAIAIVAIFGGLLGFTAPGHRVLNKLGIATADCSGGCG